MQAIGIRRFNGREALELLDLPTPKPGAHELLLKIRAAGINPVDWKIREGLLEGRMPHQFPIVLGWDASGIVEQTGHDVKQFKAGDAVVCYARKDRLHEGTYAEYIVVTANHCAMKPKNLSFEQAAVVPLSSLTAYQALHDSLKIRAGETILIHAAGGGVGGYAVPMAKKAGAKVIATASAGKHPHVRSLGADHIIDYQKTDFVDAVKRIHRDSIDAVFDTVGGTTQLKSSQVLKAGGRITSILAIQKNFFADKGLHADYVFVHPDGKQLDQIRSWIEDESIKVSLETVYPFSVADVAEAHAQIEQGHQKGKIAIHVSQ